MAVILRDAATGRLPVEHRPAGARYGPASGPALLDPRPARGHGPDGPSASAARGSGRCWPCCCSREPGRLDRPARRATCTARPPGDRGHADAPPGVGAAAALGSADGRRDAAARLPAAGRARRARPGALRAAHGGRGGGARRGDAAGRRRGCRDALGLWRGEPLADLAFEPFAAPAIARLQELRLAAIEARIDADLALGPVGRARRRAGRGWSPSTPCASACTACGCSSCTARAASARRSRPTASCGARWSTRSGSSRPRRSRTWSGRSCATTPRCTPPRRSAPEGAARSMLVAAHDAAALDALLGLAEPLGRAPGRELVVVQLVADADALPAAATALAVRRRALGVPARAAAFSSVDPRRTSCGSRPPTRSTCCSTRRPSRWTGPRLPADVERLLRGRRGRRRHPRRARIRDARRRRRRPLRRRRPRLGRGRDGRLARAGDRRGAAARRYARRRPARPTRAACWQTRRSRCSGWSASTRRRSSSRPAPSRCSRPSPARPRSSRRPLAALAGRRSRQRPPRARGGRRRAAPARAPRPASRRPRAGVGDDPLLVDRGALIRRRRAAPGRRRRGRASRTRPGRRGTRGAARRTPAPSRSRGPRTARRPPAAAAAARRRRRSGRRRAAVARPRRHAPARRRGTSPAAAGPMPCSCPSAASTNGAGSTIGDAGESSISSARSMSGSRPSVQSSDGQRTHRMPMRASLPAGGPRRGCSPAGRRRRGRPAACGPGGASRRARSRSGPSTG